MIRFLAALVVVLSLLAACGDDDEQAPGSASPSATRQFPGASRTPAASVTVPPEGLNYTVVAGDTLGAIAAWYGVTVEAIVAANDITDPASLQVGQVLLIPGSSGPIATNPPTSDPTPVQTDPDQVGLLTLVDKQHSLPSDYVPPGVISITADYVAPGYTARLRSDVMTALTEMLDASGFDIRVVSGYRSYSEQVTTFNYWVSVLGYDEAVRVSAMAGHSEHQLGSTVDLGTADYGWDLTEGFGATSPGQWLQAHAHTYGFALSYPDGVESVTGYAYEPWHFRYIGVSKAAAWKVSGLTLNQYLGG